MTNLRLISFSALLATLALIPAHELMHGFGGAIFGHGAVINLNGANPQGLEGTEQWVIFALSGTAYLFYATVVLLLAFRKWRRPYLLGISLAAGTVHQVGFLSDFVYIGISGFVFGGTNGSDPFHAGAILWNDGPLPGGTLPWREIVFAPGWPSFLIATVLVITFVTWVCLAGELAAMVTHGQEKQRLKLVSAFLLAVLIASTTVSALYVLFSAVIVTLTGWEWSVSPTITLMIGFFLICIPLIFWIYGGSLTQWPSASKRESSTGFYGH